MNSFVKRSLAFLVVQLAMFGVILSLARPAQDGYAARAIEKHERLRSLPGHRLIIIGGSNAAFGFDSRILEQRLPFAPVNMAIFAGYGLDFLTAEVSRDLRRGDVVVISPEYFNFTRPKSISRHLWRAALYRPAAARAWLALEPSLLLDHGLTMISDVTQIAWLHYYDPRATAGSPPYARYCFDEYGDVTAHWNMPTGQSIRADLIIDDVPRKEMAARVARLAVKIRQWEQRGVRAFVHLPPLPVDVRDAAGQPLRTVIEESRAILGTRLLTGYDDIGWPKSQFFDTAYHLNRQGMQQRANDLADRLHPVLNEAQGIKTSVHP